MKLLSSRDSGVVNPVLIILLGETKPNVPILPLALPHSLNILFIKNVVVVFPFVPVIPTVPILEDGFWKKLFAILAKTFLVLTTSISIILHLLFTPFSFTIATAPFFSASSIKSCPSNS